MKKITLFVVAAILAGFSFQANAQVSVADYVKDWKFPIFSNYLYGIEKAYVPNTHKQMWAKEINDGLFDPSVASFDFNKYWNSIPAMADGAGQLHGVVPENAINRKGGDDFVGEIRAAYDDYAVYVFLKAKDDDNNGQESVELMFSPYFKIDKILELHPDTANLAYIRYSNLGAYKALMTRKSLSDTYEKKSNSGTMMLTYDKNTQKFAVDWNNPLQIVKDNVFAWDHTAAGSDSIKMVFQIGWSALTGDPAGPFNQYNKDIWAASEHVHTQGSGEKYYGFAFDIKFNDKDTDDQSVPNQNGGDYWWNTISNSAFASNMFTGFIGKDGPASSVGKVNADPVFSTVTKDRVDFLKPVDVNIYSTLGKLVYAAKKVETVNLTSLDKGIYMINANGQTIKVIR